MGSAAVRFVLFLGIVHALAAVYVPVLRWGARARLVAFFVVAIVVSPLPWMVPAHARFLRSVAAIFVVALLIKLYDLHIGAGRGERPTWREIASFLINLPFGLVLRKLDDEPRHRPMFDVGRLAVAVPAFALTIWALRAMIRADWSAVPFAVEHTAKLLVAYTLVQSMTTSAEAALRLLGFRVRAALRHPILARTPADFWRRYNRPVNQFFYEDLYKPLDGRRKPIRAALIVFIASAVLHEYVALPAVGYVQGFQTAFFLVQGIATAATVRLRPRGRTALLGIAATLAFNLVTSVLFLKSIDAAVGYYTPRPTAAGSSNSGKNRPVIGAPSGITGTPSSSTSFVAE